MKNSLDAILFRVFILVTSALLAVGGASLYFVWQMMDKTRAIAEESHHVDYINQLHYKTLNLTSSIYKQTIHGNEEYAQQTFRLSNEIDQEIDAYIKLEEGESYPESKEEIRLVAALQSSVRSLRQKALMTQEMHGLDPLLHWDNVFSQHSIEIQQLVHQINQLHFTIIDRKVKKNRASMSSLKYLYGLFSLFGLAMVGYAYRLHAREVVKPVKQLARASEQIAAGELNVRVACNAKTEIGVLCNTFNDMAKRLQSHDEEVIAFNRELERKIQAVTLKLKEAHSEKLRFEKMAMLGQIATSVNHEIRTPLNALSMNVQLIKRAFEAISVGINKERRGRQTEIMSRIALVDKEVFRISDMLDEFVRFARFPPPVLTDVFINNVITHLSDMIGEKVKKARVTLSLSLSAASPNIRADENKLIQAMENLCTNAIHAMPEGGVLSLATEVKDDAVEVTVADTGTGIPEANLDKIFQPFFTSKATGFGLGLPIVQRIVEDHGGQITCRSKIGEGTVFTIRLPLINTPHKLSQ